VLRNRAVEIDSDKETPHGRRMVPEACRLPPV
jgi:hypothetical protein